MGRMDKILVAVAMASLVAFGASFAALMGEFAERRDAAFQHEAQRIPR